MRRAVLFGIVFVLCILIVPGQVYVSRVNLWKTYLEKNVECSVLLYQDGTLVITTLYMENATVLPPGVLESRPMNTLLLVAHNHVTLDRWSSMDDETNHWLRGKGYTGPILLVLGNGKTIRWED